MTKHQKQKAEAAKAAAESARRRSDEIRAEALKMKPALEEAKRALKGVLRLVGPVSKKAARILDSVPAAELMSNYKPLFRTVRTMTRVELLKDCVLDALEACRQAGRAK